MGTIVLFTIFSKVAKYREPEDFHKWVIKNTFHLFVFITLGTVLDFYVYFMVVKHLILGF